jgi:hypothetical protein
MFSMLSLVGLAATYLPDLIRLIAGDKAGTVAAAVTRAVTEVTKTADPEAAQKTLQTDMAAAAELRIRLAQIALGAQKAQADSTEVSFTDARGGDIAWGAPAVSLVVTIGFFAVLAVLAFCSRTIAASADATVTQILNISVGTLATGFATVVNFWLGSSQSSRSKDTATRQMQATHAAQLGTLIDTVTSVARSPTETTAIVPTPSPLPTIVASAPKARTTDNFDRCIAVTLAHEGGFTDNAADPGGATNFGITLRTLEAFLGHAVTPDDVRALSSSTAIEIYRANYWNQLRCGDLPAGVDLMMLDFGVNSGPATAVKALQALVQVTRDGAIGRQTLDAVARVAPMTLVDGLAQARMACLRSLPSFTEFGDGWTRRVGDVQQKAQRMVG